jgi:hypothetical protein
MKILMTTLGLLMLGCASGNPPVDGVPGSAVGDLSERAAAVPPIYSLLGQREALALSSDQIAALDSIGMWLESANRPLIDEVFDRGVRRDPDPILREGDPPRLSREGRPMLVDLAENNEAAEAGVGAVLTADQRGSVCALFRRLREDPRREIPHSTARLRVAPGFGAPDGGNYRWSWCEE